MSYSRSFGDRRRWASRARASAAEARAGPTALHIGELPPVPVLRPDSVPELVGAVLICDDKHMEIAPPIHDSGGVQHLSLPQATDPLGGVRVSPRFRGELVVGSELGQGVPRNAVFCNAEEMQLHNPSRGCHHRQHHNGRPPSPDRSVNPRGSLDNASGEWLSPRLEAGEHGMGDNCNRRCSGRPADRANQSPGRPSP